MSFPFRRRSANQFKHIAHGLIPAATVAPRSAVPRTPPPRSPNPSPERPRSALAAAILMTSLTGRTVAIPQPRQRSYSENDSAGVEDQIEPYATARDLGVQQNWETYADGRDVTSPVMSFQFEEDDTEEQMSDFEGERIEHPEGRRGESESQEPLYATPQKDRQKKTQPGIRQEVESERSSPEVSNYPVETEFHTTEDHRVASPIPHPESEESKEQPEPLVRKDSSVKANPRAPERRQNQEDEDNNVQLRGETPQLTDRNPELNSQVQQLRQQIKAMRAKMKTLKSEKRDFQELLQNSHAEGERRNQKMKSWQMLWKSQRPVRDHRDILNFHRMGKVLG